MVTTNDEIDNIKEELRKNLTQNSNSKGKSNDNNNNNNQRMNSFRYPAILLIGDTGVGKSTLGNWLLGHHGDDGPFETQASFDRVTLEPQTALIEINGCKYNLIDTPGLFDLKDDSRSEISLTKLANTINHCSYGIQTIIFVVKKSFGKEIDRQIQAIKGFLGEKSLDHMLIAFTHCNMEQTMDRIVMKETFTSKMKKFLDYIDNRWIISPNPDLFNLDDDVVYTNIYEAKDIIGSFPEAYTTEMFNRVRRAREDAEEAARRHAQEERLRSCEEELARIRGEVDKAGRLKANEEARKACFSLDTIVTLKDGRKIEMSEVKIGDHVACGVYNNGGIKEIRYSEVYLIAHLDKHQQTEFLKVEYIKPDGMTGSLYLTSEHHVFVDNAFDYARNIRPHASQIHVLDNGESISVKVTNVSKETREGYIAIFTRVGTIIANNVLCSCYSNCPPYQNTIHYILSPLRFITLFRKSNHYSNEIHPYLKFLYNNYQYFSGTFKHKLC